MMMYDFDNNDLSLLWTFVIDRLYKNTVLSGMPGKTLDIGCGTGHNKTYNIALNEISFELRHTRSPNIEFIRHIVIEQIYRDMSHEK